MSWIERIENNISITTGDGKTFSPEYSIGSKSVDYNIAEFEFPNIGGTLVKRSKYKGTKYSLQVIFQGETNVDDARDFELSARDERPWKISHPMYDNIIVQPTSMSFDNTGLNITRINIEIIETITDDAPKTSQDPKDKTSQDILTQQETAAGSFVNDVSPSVGDLNTLSDNTSTSYSLGADIVSDNVQANEYFNLFNKANSAILNGASDVSLMITAIQDVITYPSIFKVGVLTRLNLLKDQMLKLSESLDNLTTPNSKKIYENNGGALIMAMVNASINPFDDNDYGNKKDVLNVIDVILDFYNLYLSNLDSIQTENGGEIDSYIPDFQTLNQLTSVVGFAVSQLFTISIGAKQERIILLENDSNIIELSHRFYGLNIDDSKIDEFMRNNNIGISELLQIEKGREIIYYV
ncbi:MAG: hypothetical protein JKY43_05395 [Phycisphaerales bacterium]|nr:hypothetical protein [Phycisphaerales bacterium]